MKDKSNNYMEHFYDNIFPDYFDYANLYSMVVEEAKDESKFVEIGCLHGRSSCYLGVEIIRSGKKISVDFIDPWFKYDPQMEYADKIPDREAYKEFLNNIAKIDGLNHRTIRLESKEASELYHDKSLDLVFIDGDHSYNSVSADLHAWFKKVKPGGTIAGHDYPFQEVRSAVHDFFDRLDGSGQVDQLHHCWIWRKS